MSSVKKNEAWALSEAKARISEIIRLAEKGPQRIQVSGQPAGAIISEQDLQLFLELKREQTAKLLDDLMRVSEEEGIYAEDFGELRTPIKEVNLK